MEITKTTLGDVLLIKLDVFEDYRGEYIETYNEELYRKKGINIKFVQDDISVSTKNVLRGIHGDSETWKLISCLYGKFYLVVVNCDVNSENFGKWESFVLSDVNRLQVLVPPKYGNAHLILSDKVIFHYKQSNYYNPAKQFTYKWNDPKFNIWWPVKNPVLSQRDEEGHYV
jgi:dTDP-4-dehydrorhamnose 3,5-epimerase